MILITGATGYIGSHLVTRLVEQGERPRCLVRDKRQAATVLPEAQVEFIEGATTRPDTLAQAVQGVDTIIHAAFLTADRKESAQNHYAATNIDGTRHLIEAAKTAHVQKIIEVSGLGTKPDKPGSYMQGRYLAEKMLIDSGLRWTIIRPSVLFGEGSSFIKGLTSLLQSAPVAPLIGGGKTLFQPIYVEDVVTAIYDTWKRNTETDSQIYTIGGPEYYSFREIYDILLRSNGLKRPKVYAPTPLVGIGAAVLEAVLPKPPITKAAMSLFSFDNITDLNSVERDFGFVPQSFVQYMEAHSVKNA